MSEPYIGQITMFGGNFAIRGFALCHGQTLSISQNAALFSILGTTFGGDGRTTFGLPDLRGRIAMQQGTGPGLPPVALGQKGGDFEHQLTISQMPSHNHNVNAQCNGNEANSDDPIGAFLGATSENLYHTTANAEMGPANCSFTGGGQAYSIQNPFLGINFLIALIGVFPPRN